MSQSEEKSDRSEEEDQEQDQKSNTQEEENQDEDNSQQQQEQGEEDDNEDQEEEENQDDQEEQEQEGSQSSNKQEDGYKLPSFPKLDQTRIDTKPTIQSIGFELNNIQLSVDSFINSLSSNSTNGNFYSQNNVPALGTGTGKGYFSLPIDSMLKTENYKSDGFKNKVHIKDSQVQVDMQPSIVIHNINRQLPPLQKKSSYVINSESQNYLSKLGATTKTEINKFERKQQDLINWEKRNKQIDEAMRIMRTQF